MYVVSKASFDSIPPITLGLLRLLIGGTTLSVLLWLSRRFAAKKASLTLPPQMRRRFPLLGATIAATVITQFIGTNLATAHEGALLTTITPVFIIPLAWFLLRERTTMRVIVGMLIALVGVILVIGIPSTVRTASSLVGAALLLISALFWALFTVLGTPLVRMTSALMVSTYATLWSLLFFAPFAVWELLQHPLTHLAPTSIGSILYLGIGATALAWFLWYKGVERFPASIAAVFFFAQPLVGSLLSAFFLHESLSVSFWLGGCVLAAGILLVSWER
jgi:drug/metabolite transporter (DMT)-like permease